MGYGTRRMLRRFTHLLLLPVLSGTLLVLSFPTYELDFLAWIALAPLLIAIREKPWKTAFGQGWLAGLVFFVGTLSWVINAMHQYGKIPFPVSFFVMLLLAGYCALTVALAAGLVAFVVDYGYWRLDPRNNPTNEHSLRIGLVQPNIDQAQKWDVAFRRQSIDRYKKLTGQVVQEVDLVVWPEAATPFFFDVETDYREELLRFVRERGVPLLFGSPALDSKSEGSPRLFNSAYLVSSTGTVLDRYDKVHLVPFGEYVPLKPVFFFLNKLVVGLGDFVPGSDPRVMSGPSGHLGVVVCFEVIFPNLVRQFVDRGAYYMVTITNDAWFGRTSAPYQHFAMVVFRAVENRVPCARAANTGSSGFIAAEGHILRTTDI